MDQTIIDNINTAVGQNDSLYVVGDFSFRASRTVREYLERIHCQNVYLVKGNHDGPQIHTAGFKWIKDLHELHHNGERYVLCHYPMVSWNAQFHGSFHIYGHVHNNMPDIPGKRCLNVGVDVTGFHPIPLEEARRRMLEKSPKSPKEMLRSLESSPSGGYNV